MSNSVLQKLWKWAKGLLGNLIEMVPPRDLTVTRIGVTELRIRAYWKTNGQLPTSLSDLPILEGRDNATTDGWGKPLKYDIRQTSIVTLSSLSIDRIENDAGSVPDIVVTFDVSNEPIR